MEHEEALEDKSNGHGDEGSSSRMPQHDINTVAGMSKKLDELWRCLKDDDGSTVIGVHGPRGAGKTTLLRELSEAGKAEFSPVISVTLQRSGPMVEILQEQIESRLGLPSDDFVLDPGSRATAIFDALKNEKFLLILDDVWQEFYLGIAGIPLGSYNKSGGKVILATSSRSLCVSMGAERLVKVEHLSKEEAWYLFREKVGGDTIDSDPHIEKLAMVIAEGCQGLPLAISMVGAVMATKRMAEEWEQAVLELRPKLAGRKSMEYSIFRFCFINLRDDCMRSCFLYCCALPECHFNKHELIARWIEGGFLDGFDFKAHAEGENIITGLKASGLIEGCLHCEAEVRLHHHIKHMAYQYIFSGRSIPESVFRPYRREVEFWKLAAGRGRSPKAVSANGGPAHVIVRAVNWIARMSISDLRACFLYAYQTMRLLHFHNLWVLDLSLRQSNGHLYSNLQQLWYLTEVYLDLSYITVLIRMRAITRLLQWPLLQIFLYGLNSVSDGYEREVDHLKLKCYGGDDEREARNWRLFSCGGDDEREFGNWRLINRSGDDEREFRNWRLAGRGVDDEREIGIWRLTYHGGDDKREFGNWSLICDGGDDERELGTWSLIGCDGDEEKEITCSLMIRQGGDDEREFGNWSLLGDEGDEEKERRDSSLMLRRGGDDEREFGNWSLLGHGTGESGFVKEAKENGSSSIGHGGDDEREFGNWRLVSCGNDRVRQLNLQDLEGLQNL